MSTCHVFLPSFGVFSLVFISVLWSLSSDELFADVNSLSVLSSGRALAEVYVFAELLADTDGLSIVSSGIALFGVLAVDDVMDESWVSSAPSNNKGCE